MGITWCLCWCRRRALVQAAWSAGPGSSEQGLVVWRDRPGRGATGRVVALFFPSWWASTRSAGRSAQHLGGELSCLTALALSVAGSGRSQRGAWALVHRVWPHRLLEPAGGGAGA
ncbi:hypothetical protein NDU88_006714 [Pleurodeles waltl]|uniref:Secreted protein n=1 Tax=Pleurodeles waltl TaxID=8319 RepID=A0AAV7RQY5_PLEWA|nr:hypothetical protein NDU88_006714 [Pleurodeles waltl]